MEFYSIVRRNERIHTTMGMEFRGTVQRERSQFFTVPLIDHSGNVIKV